jgi:hypothetical protein
MARNGTRFNAIRGPASLKATETSLKPGSASNIFRATTFPTLLRRDIFEYCQSSGAVGILCAWDCWDRLSQSRYKNKHKCASNVEDVISFHISEI